MRPWALRALWDVPDDETRLKVAEALRSVSLLLRLLCLLCRRHGGLGAQVATRAPLCAGLLVKLFAPWCSVPKALRPLLVLCVCCPRGGPTAEADAMCQRVVPSHSLHRTAAACVRLADKLPGCVRV